MRKTVLFYLTTLVFFGGLIWFILKLGKDQFDAGKFLPNASNNIPVIDTGFLIHLQEQASSPLSKLLLQIIVIVILARISGFCLRKLGQPAVVGEIIAGIILGPSVLGAYLPEFSSFIFPKESLLNLQFLSQIGLAFFMFVVGMELEIEKIWKKAGEALVVSHATIILPFFLGVTFAYFFYEKFETAHTNFISFGLFMGIAMSITAFPVLARILQERNLSKTSLGNMAITCAAVDDITAWSLLAVIIGIAKAQSPFDAVVIVVMTILFVILMIKIVAPFLSRLLEKKIDGKYTRTVIILSFIVLFISAYITELIGIHALFGAFLAGTIMPVKQRFREILTDKIEDVSVVILLPIFFAITGLRTQFGLLTAGSLWLTCIIVILLAVIGKFGGAALASRFMGLSWKDALSLGALMNTRGLMELVVLNIGYDLGILSPEIFAIMVLMALSTTFMTGPLLNLIRKSATAH